MLKYQVFSNRQLWQTHFNASVILHPHFSTHVLRVFFFRLLFFKQTYYACSSRKAIDLELRERRLWSTCALLQTLKIGFTCKRDYRESRSWILYSWLHFRSASWGNRCQTAFERERERERERACWNNTSISAHIRISYMQQRNESIAMLKDILIFINHLNTADPNIIHGLIRSSISNSSRCSNTKTKIKPRIQSTNYV